MCSVPRRPGKPDPDGDDGINGFPLSIGPEIFEGLRQLQKIFLFKDAENVTQYDCVIKY
jgi:hypothetical protein